MQQPAPATAALPRAGRPAAGFLPDLCAGHAVFVVVIVSELAALVIVIADTGFGAGFVDGLALVSMYTQGLGLSAAAALCLARRHLGGLDERRTAALSYLLVLAVCYGVAELAWWVVNPVVGEGALIRLSRADLLLRTVAIGAIVAALVLRYFYVQFHWQQRMASEATARLEALQARIRPHFFFNCMNSIASLTRSDPVLAERAVEDLAELFRASLADARALVPVAEEVAFVERYLAIERLRLGERLVVAWHGPAAASLPADACLPRLTLQPIVENAIYHGIEPARAGGEVAIELALEPRRLVVRITNPVPAAAGERSGNRIALDNVRQRLRAHFGEAAALAVANDGRRYQVEIAVPRRSATA